MRPFGAWFGRVAVAGSCLAWAGCGGGDVPDPDSDSTAAAEAPTQVVDRSGAQAPAEAPAAEPAKSEPATPPREEPAAAVASNPPAAEAPAPAQAPAAEPEKAAAVVKGDASGTEDMLRIAATPPQEPAQGEAAATPGNPAGSFPGAGPGMAGRPGMAGPAGMPGGRGAGRGRDEEGAPPSATPGIPQSPPGGFPGAPGGFEGLRPGMTGGPPIPGGQGMPGGPGGFGGPGSLSDSAPVGPDTFNHAGTAVQAFLSALKQKNKDRLAQATARRAATEAIEKHRKVFSEIIDGSISDDELDEMSKAMEGFQVSQVLPAKSSGRINVVVSKREGPDTRQRTITVRKEQELWKVMDISDALLFKAQGIMRTRRP